MILVLANIAEIAAAVICTTCLVIKPSVLNRWFVLFLWTTVVIELMGKLTIPIPHTKTLMFNLWNGIEFFFYFFFFYFNFNKKILSCFFLGAILAFLLFYLYNLFFLQGFYKYNTHTHTIGASLIILLCLAVIYAVLSDETRFYTASKAPLLCIIFGLLVYYTGNIANTALYNYFAKNDPKEAVRLYKLINHNLNVILYSTFCIAFALELKRNRPIHNS
jgi:hypothetical protein